VIVDFLARQPQPRLDNFGIAQRRGGRREKHFAKNAQFVGFAMQRPWRGDFLIFSFLCDLGASARELGSLKMLLKKQNKTLQ
jgi:hypothetical protein